MLDAFKNCKVIAFDRDPSVRRHAELMKTSFPDRFMFIHSKFSGCTGFKERIMEFTEGNPFNCIIMDLGLCSIQVLVCHPSINVAI